MRPSPAAQAPRARGTPRGPGYDPMGARARMCACRRDGTLLIQAKDFDVLSEVPAARALVLGSWGNTMRGAVRSKER